MLIDFFLIYSHYSRILMLENHLTEIENKEKKKECIQIQCMYEG